MKRLALLVLCAAAPSHAETCDANGVTASQKQVLCAQDQAAMDSQNVQLAYLALILAVTRADDIETAMAAPQAQPFVQSQQDWTAFAASTCKAEAQIYAGGTLMEMFAAQCTSRLAQERTRYLAELATRPRG